MNKRFLKIWVLPFTILGFLFKLRRFKIFLTLLTIGFLYLYYRRNPDRVKQLKQKFQGILNDLFLAFR
jgi:hypothetical protein